MKTIFVSYDGALDPLGGSQIIPYLEGLAARGVNASLISFEKRARWRGQWRHTLARRLGEVGISWLPQVYHQRPRSLATLADLFVGVRALRREMQRSPATIIHCRGDVATTIARWARPSRGVQVLYDIRGFFADERVESGSWRQGSVLDQLVRRMERANLQRADGVVVLTHAAHRLLGQRRSPLPHNRVIPTCVDTKRFRPGSSGPSSAYSVVYSGSLGTWYLAPEMVSFAQAAASLMGKPALFLTPQSGHIRDLAPTGNVIEVREVAHAEVPTWLRSCRAALCFVRPTPAKRASCPTKVGEALATGLPVVCTTGIGDLDDFLEKEGVGVLVRSVDHQDHRSAALRLLRLLSDPSLPGRCRRIAEERFSLEKGVASYHDLYGELARAQTENPVGTQRRSA